MSSHAMIKQLLSSQLRINMAASVATTFVNLVLLVFSYPLYLHFLGYDQFGLWFILATVLNITQLGNLGISQAVTKLVAEEYSRNNMEVIKAYVYTAIEILFASGVLIMVVILLFKYDIIKLFKLNSEHTHIVIRLIPYIGLLSIYIMVVDVLNATLSGLGRMDIANYCQIFGRAIVICVAIILLYRGYGIESLLIANIIGYICVHITSLLCIYRKIKILFIGVRKVELQPLKKLLSFGGAVFGGSVIAILWGPFNKMMLSRYAGVAVIPIFEITYNGTVQIRSLIESVLRPVMPEISSLQSTIMAFSVQKIRRIKHNGMKLIVGGGLPLFGIIFVVAEPLLKLWLSDKYNECFPTAFRLMLICNFISLMNVPSYYTLLGFGKAVPSLISGIIFSGGNAVFVTFLVSLTGTLSVNVIFIGAIIFSIITTIYLIKRSDTEVKIFEGQISRMDKG